MEWISVKDRLPEIGHDKSYPDTSEHILMTNKKIIYYGVYEKFRGGHCFIDYDGNDLEDDGIKITHWMPLPEPPKE